MSNSIEDLEKQRAALDAEIEALIASNRADARASVLQLIEDLGYTLEDLFGKPKNGTLKPKPKPKYVGPNGETWGGGRGRRPDWLNKAIADGAKLEDFDTENRPIK